MALKLKFLGSLRQAYGSESLSVDCAGGSIIDLIHEISSKKPELRKSLLDEYLTVPRANALILVNGKEISVLDGLATKVQDGDEVVFIPVVHGG
jgi:molybdopterin synthase sulfur carrier subunit